MSNLCLTCNHVLLFEDVILVNGVVTCVECVKASKLAKKLNWDNELPTNVQAIKALLDDLSTTNVLDTLSMGVKLRCIHDKLMLLSLIVGA